jgi:hypothetical protein
MGYLSLILYPWNFILQGIAIVHFIRRRPDTYWLWIILIGGGLGAIVYIAVEVIPDFGLLRQSFRVFPRRRRIRELEGVILDKPCARQLRGIGRSVFGREEIRPRARVF